jgi:pilus assembly protein CpaE
MSSTTNPTPAPRAALISPDPSFRSLVTTCLDASAPFVEWVLRAETDVTELRPESVERLAERDPEILFLDVGSSLSAGVRFVAAVTARLPGLNVIAAGGALGVEELLELIRAGASGYLRRPFSHNEVTQVCANALRKLPVKTPEAARPGTQIQPCRVIALFAPKGGTGVSTLATNLAVHIRRATSKKTLLMDLSAELGTASVLMGVEPRYSYLDVMENLQRMDERLLHSFLEEHGTGTRILASPDAASRTRELPQEHVVAVFRLLRRHFEYVLVDVGRSVMDDAVAEVLELADETIVVTTPELPTLRNVKQALFRMARDRKPGDAVRLVVNRYEDGISLPPKDIERAVGLAPFEILSEDRERVGRSVNLGQPLVMNGSSPYARGVGKIGDRLAGIDGNGRGGRSLGGLLRTLLPGREKADAGGNGRKPVTGAGARGAQRPATDKEGAAGPANGNRTVSNAPSPYGRERPQSAGARPDTTRNGRPDVAPAPGVSAADAGRRTLEDGVR